MIKGFGAVACVKLIWESYSSCFQQVCKKYSPIQVALIGPHVGRLCRGAEDWMGPGKWTPSPVWMQLLQVTLAAPGAMHKVAFPSLGLYLCCSENTAIFRLLNVLPSAGSVVQLPFVGLFLLFLLLYSVLDFLQVKYIFKPETLTIHGEKLNDMQYGYSD